VCTNRRITALALLVVAALVASGCNDDDGRTLREPAPGATVPNTLAPETLGTTAPLALTSSAFADGQPIPDRSSCKGEDVSPPLEWTGVPPAAAEVAIVVRDRDAGGFVHWVLSGLSVEVAGLAEGALPEGAIEGRNGFGTEGWRGPCPPSGVHTYVFTLHVLSEPIGLAPGLSAVDAAALIEQASIDKTDLTGTFAG
jgi:Raf kinase inhibitor-like YbhB/YbcL family protein